MMQGLANFKNTAIDLKLKMKEGNGKLKRCTNICHYTNIEYEIFQIIYRATFCTHVRLPTYSA
jgi:hypothetical protein